MGARVSVTGMASHHHTAAIVLKDSRRSASGVRREIGSVLRRKVRRLAGHRPSAKHSFHATETFLTSRLYHAAMKLRDCWTKSKLSVMAIHRVFAAIGTHLSGITHLNGITGRATMCQRQQVGDFMRQRVFGFQNGVLRHLLARLAVSGFALLIGFGSAFAQS